jgi:uridine kinase
MYGIERDRHNRRAIIFLFSAATHALYGNDLTPVIDHSFADGYFGVMKEERPINTSRLSDIVAKMWELKNSDNQIQYNKTLPIHWKHLHAPKFQGKKPPLLRLNGFEAPSFEFTTLDLENIPDFDLVPYENGFVLRIGKKDQERFPAFVTYPKLFKAMKSSEDWARVLKIPSISELNEQIETHGFKEMIWVAEGLHEKQLAAISDGILKRPKIKFIFIAGPSSSGKTTFTKRLAIQLRVNGINSKLLSMDDYFISREKMIPLPDGTLDFESIDCMDISLLQQDFKKLENGEPIFKREYDFQRGEGQETEETITLAENEVLIIEGIHGLNPALSANISKETFYRIYTSALTSLNMDNFHPISTSDSRLIRRMVRDYNFRGYSVEDTLNRWQSVRYGEMHNIFPYQEEADAMFNSALVYEMSVLRQYALPLLRQAPKSTVRDRLITLLSFFHRIPDKFVPGTSILREFIGKSYFTY